MDKTYVPIEDIAASISIAFKRMQKGYIENQFGGGNAGSALCGALIRDGLYRLSEAIERSAKEIASAKIGEDK